MKKFVVRADRSDDPSVRRDYVTNGLESGITAFILRKGDERFEQLGKIEAIYSQDGEIADDSYGSVDIDTPEAQEFAMSLAGKKKAVLVRTSDWTVIPLENVITRFGGTGTEVYAVTSDPDEIKLFLTTMEKGVDGIVIDVENPLDVRKFGEKLLRTGKEELTEVTVTSVRSVDMGDRVCIDTCSMMVPGEGMLIGSYSNCLFLIQSESEENGYVASRPFRVNAGAVHSYMEVPGGGTKYLVEISAGDPVLLCDREGNTRIASVGRCKVEKRPLLMVAATDGNREYTVILQNAETIKMVGPDGAISVTRIAKGDRILAKLDAVGRHFGMAIEETISEK